MSSTSALYRLSFTDLCIGYANLTLKPQGFLQETLRAIDPVTVRANRRPGRLIKDRRGLSCDCLPINAMPLISSSDRPRWKRCKISKFDEVIVAAKSGRSTPEKPQPIKEHRIFQASARLNSTIKVNEVRHPLAPEKTELIREHRIFQAIARQIRTIK
ncbi:uncharacterized protein MYCFIDRAFT_176587 [Pseudocercospora fijiensis CIRAD86]|uniref:Uncharacterized protein n=1 Tax=Pseudocercospora fijiensis (strain CIRAD86) TaxID=383855 RepID=M2ZQF6_PSEFD|nr:uncharacterized protein MYCFIDRAFT_176587 [Pseudocercospora fijiensis CIRAD86]EME81294.1 hypothetical protein MYCFIDRAFT_176587 [Pseudocercospora fijiensis CIRAD86]